MERLHKNLSVTASVHQQGTLTRQNGNPSTANPVKSDSTAPPPLENGVKSSAWPPQNGYSSSSQTRAESSGPQIVSRLPQWPPGSTFKPPGPSESSSVSSKVNGWYSGPTQTGSAPQTKSDESGSLSRRGGSWSGITKPLPPPPPPPPPPPLPAKALPVPSADSVSVSGNGRVDQFDTMSSSSTTSSASSSLTSSIPPPPPPHATKAEKGKFLFQLPFQK